MVHIGPDIQVKILGIRRQRVKLGVEAPRDVRVWRGEVTPEPIPSEMMDPDLKDQGGAKALPILIVEDNPDHAHLIQRVLDDGGFTRHEVASTGQDALDALGADRETPSAGSFAGEWGPPFLVFLDYRLPDASGLDVLRRIRSNPRLRTTPVVVFSIEREESVVASCLEAGANAFVPKSSDFGTFRQSVSRVVAFWSGNCWVPRPIHATA
ncbi:MAG: response regulator [Pirellulales bacterium]|nr:response regulator [Pirellulales bacterium]